MKYTTWINRKRRYQDRVLNEKSDIFWRLIPNITTFLDQKIQDIQDFIFKQQNMLDKGSGYILKICRNVSLATSCPCFFHLVLMIFKTFLEKQYVIHILYIYIYTHLAILCDLFGMVKWPFKCLSDLQIGDEKVTLNHLAYMFWLTFTATKGQLCVCFATYHSNRPSQVGAPWDEAVESVGGNPNPRMKT